MGSECDVLLLGLGAAGSVIAGRLARADPSLRITAVEQGPDVKARCFCLERAHRTGQPHCDDPGPVRN